MIEKYVYFMMLQNNLTIRVEYRNEIRTKRWIDPIRVVSGACTCGQWSVWSVIRVVSGVCTCGEKCN